jgi:hypothetical protein
MTFTKPNDITFQQISEQSHVGLRTVKRYASGENVTLHNAEAIKKAVYELQTSTGTGEKKSIVPISEKDFFFPKALFRQNLFWSSPIDKVRNIDGVIEAYVKTPNLYDIYTLVRLFGAKRVMNIAHDVYISILNQYGLSVRRLSSLPEYQAVDRMVRYSSAVGRNQ